MMGKRVIAVVVVILIIGAIAFGLSRNSNKNTSNQNTPSSASSQSSQNNQSLTSTNSVTIQNFAFTPGDITVKKGTTVTWTNNDSTAHSVNETDNQKGPDSGDLNPGDKYSFTFNQSGTFKYRCNLHPEMLGTVTVTD
jgi:plastocyanin